MKSLRLYLVAVCACLLLPLVWNTALHAAYEAFSDINADPMVAGGLSQVEVQSYIENGWEKKTTGADIEAVIVRFRDSATDQLVWRIGTVPAETEYIKNIVSGAVVVIEGANTVHPDSKHLFD